jgi:phosphatidylethanolamine/phosphatidyl-N-methylethanolamine N-methyltransferase
MQDNAGSLSYGAFLRGLIHNPKGVSAPTPSSSVLAEAIAAELDLSRPGLVVELGPGTGAVTAALQRRVGPARILAVERETSFIAPLRTRFPDVDIRCGDALAFEHFLPPDTVIAAMVSGLPLLHLPQQARRSLLERALACQGPGGLFIQLSYSWRPPVRAETGMTLTKRAIWQNFPPAHVWTYKSAPSALRT